VLYVGFIQYNSTSRGLGLVIYDVFIHFEYMLNGNTSNE